MDKVLELAKQAGQPIPPKTWIESFYTLARADLLEDVKAVGVQQEQRIMDLEAENAKLRSFAQEYVASWEGAIAVGHHETLLEAARAALGENE